MTAPDYTWKLLLLPSLWIIPWIWEALATVDMVTSLMWWVSGALLLLCHPCEITLAAVPRQFPPGWGS